MTEEMRRRCMLLLSRARDGDALAHKDLVDKISREFMWMVRKGKLTDPSISWEDVLQEWYWGIWRGIHLVDLESCAKNHGDPLYYLALRGKWAVLTFITNENKRRYGTTKEGTTFWSLDAMEGSDFGDAIDKNTHGRIEMIDDSPEADLQCMAEQNETQEEAHRRLTQIFAIVDLLPRHWELLHHLAEGDLDLEERGAQVRLGQELGVSRQYVGQLVKSLVDRCARAEAELVN